MRGKFIAKVALGALLIAGSAQAQQPASQPANQPPSLGKVVIPGSNYEIVFGMAELPQGSQTEQPAHAGVVIVYVAHGEIWYLIDGQPAQPFKVGDALQVPERGFPSGGPGGSASAVMVVYIVEREKPAVAAAMPRSQ